MGLATVGCPSPGPSLSPCITWIKALHAISRLARVEMQQFQPTICSPCCQLLRCCCCCSLQVSGADYDEASCVINKHDSFLVWVSVCDVLLRLPSGLACLPGLPVCLPLACFMLINPFCNPCRGELLPFAALLPASSTLPSARGLLWLRSVWVTLAATCTTHTCAYLASCQLLWSSVCSVVFSCGLT